MMVSVLSAVPLSPALSVTCRWMGEGATRVEADRLQVRVVCLEKGLAISVRLENAVIVQVPRVAADLVIAVR